MRIDNLTSIDYTITNTNGLIHMVFTDTITNSVVGEFRIQDNKGRSFLEVLKTIFEESYGLTSAFSDNLKAKASLKNKTQGNIKFSV